MPLPALSLANQSPSAFARDAATIEVLITNDNPQLTRLLENILSTLGFRQLFSAHSAQGALDIMREIHIRLALVDWELKVVGGREHRPQIATINGVEFTRRLRHSRSSPNPYLPVLLLAPNLNGTQTLGARDGGINGLILKPLEARQLCTSIREIIEKPRIFVTAPTYRGPDRRAVKDAVTQERRKRDICIVKRQFA